MAARVTYLEKHDGWPRPCPIGPDDRVVHLERGAGRAVWNVWRDDEGQWVPPNLTGKKTARNEARGQWCTLVIWDAGGPSSEVPAASLRLEEQVA